MSKEAKTPQYTYRKVAGWIMAVVGTMMLIGGLGAYGAVTAQLKDQHMVVPADANSNAGKTVAGPITAWSMQETIRMHADTATDGVSYAELGDVVNQLKEEHGEDSEEVAAAQAQRDLQQNAAFLRSSILTSVLSFGVALLAMGTGLMGLLAGTVFIRSPKPKAQR